MKTLSVLVIAALISIPMQKRFGEVVIIDTPVEGDLYVAAGTVTVNAPVAGDLVVAGGTVIVNDSVKMDALVTGGNVILNGYVGDDVRCGSGSLTISGTVAGDVLEASGELTLQKEGLVEGNVVAWGGKMNVDGTIKGDLQVAAGELHLDGTVSGMLDARAEKIFVAGRIIGQSSIAAPSIVVDPSARFEGAIHFWNSSGNLEMPDIAHQGDIIFDPDLKIETPRWELLGFASVLVMWWYLGTALVMIWVIEYLFARTFRSAAAIVLEQSMKSIGYGLTFIVGVPVICAVLAVTVLGLPIAVIAMLTYVILAVLATAITAIVVSNWLNRVYYKSEWSLVRIVFVAFAVFVFLKLFTLTPVVGPLLMIIMSCMAFGALLISVKNRPVAGA